MAHIVSGTRWGSSAPLADPAHPGVGAAILGITGRMVEQHHNRASRATVAATFQQSLSKIRAAKRVVLIPDATAPNSLAAELHGDLAMVLLLAEQAAWEPKAAAGKPLTLKHKKRPGTYIPGRQLSVVAGGSQPA